MDIKLPMVVYEDTLCEEVAVIMTSMHYDQLPVVNRSDKCVPWNLFAINFSSFFSSKTIYWQMTWVASKLSPLLLTKFL